MMTEFKIKSAFSRQFILLHNNIQGCLKFDLLLNFGFNLNSIVTAIGLSVCPIQD